MTTRTFWSWAAPSLLAGAAWIAVLAAGVEPGPARNGIALGLLVALAQSLASLAALKIAWRSERFYVVWAGGVLARLVVFGVTAAAVHGAPAFGFAATLLTLAIATMIFLTVELLLSFSN